MWKTLLTAIRVTMVSVLLLLPLKITATFRWTVAFQSPDALTRRRQPPDSVTKAWPHSSMRLGYSNSNDDLAEVVADASSPISASRYDTPASSGGVEMDVIMPYHRPLGCVIEESLASSSSSQPNHYTVFVASVTEGGAAAQAGLLPGDVIVGLSNSLLQQQPCVDTNMTTTDTVRSVVLTNVTGWGIDSVYVSYILEYLATFVFLIGLFSHFLTCYYYNTTQEIIHSVSCGRFTLSIARSTGYQCHGGARGGPNGIVFQSGSHFDGSRSVLVGLYSRRIQHGHSTTRRRGLR
jgi:hypothetical protein